jgi:hypothetical protein
MSACVYNIGRQMRHAAALVVILIARAVLGADGHQIAASRCRQTFGPGPGSQYMGHAGWQDQADKTIAGSTENRTVGQALLICTVRLSAPAASAVLDIKGARVTFSGQHADSAASGLEIAALDAKERVCMLRATRASRENWIELGTAHYALDFRQPVDRISVTLRLIDLTAAGSVRADVTGVSVRLPRTGETLSACPPAPQ